MDAASLIHSANHSSHRSVIQMHSLVCVTNECKEPIHLSKWMAMLLQIYRGLVSFSMVYLRIAPCCPICLFEGRSDTPRIARFQNWFTLSYHQTPTASPLGHVSLLHPHYASRFYAQTSIKKILWCLSSFPSFIPSSIIIWNPVDVPTLALHRLAMPGTCSNYIVCNSLGNV